MFSFFTPGTLKTNKLSLVTSDLNSCFLASSRCESPQTFGISQTSTGATRDHTRAKDGVLNSTLPLTCVALFPNNPYGYMSWENIVETSETLTCFTKDKQHMQLLRQRSGFAADAKSGKTAVGMEGKSIHSQCVEPITDSFVDVSKQGGSDVKPHFSNLAIWCDQMDH